MRLECSQQFLLLHFNYLRYLQNVFNKSTKKSQYGNMYLYMMYCTKTHLYLSDQETHISVCTHVFLMFLYLDRTGKEMNQSHI